MKRYFSILLMIVIALGVGLYQLSQNQSIGTRDQIADLKFPQDATMYLSQTPLVLDSDENLNTLKNEYLAKFLSPLRSMTPNPNSQEVFWMQKKLVSHPGYAQDLQKNSPEFLQSILDQMQIDTYPNASQVAIITKDTNVRVVPSLNPSFSRMNGYPLDRWQNSSIFYGTPVLITQYDTTRRFAHIQTEFIYGWVEVSDLALLNPQQIQTLLHIQDFVMPEIDEVILKTQSQAFLTQARIGKLFFSPSKDHILGFLRDSKGNAVFESIPIEPTQFHAFPQPFSQVLVAKYINTLLGQKYGWGGMYESRDCSSLIRDIYANFGLYLPRNSAAQAFYENLAVKFDTLSTPEKERKILQEATPFATLLWLKGHIMIYIGHNQLGEPMVAHSAWEIESKSLFGKKRSILGGVYITTLKPADEYNGIWIKNTTLADRLRTMTDLSLKFREQE